MQLFLRTLTIFLGTLIAAALVALGEPALAELKMVRDAAPTWEHVLLALRGRSG